MNTAEQTIYHAVVDTLKVSAPGINSAIRDGIAISVMLKLKDKFVFKGDE